jgi:hypothetical protein
MINYFEFQNNFLVPMEAHHSNFFQNHLAKMCFENSNVLYIYLWLTCHSFTMEPNLQMEKDTFFSMIQEYPVCLD